MYMSSRKVPAFRLVTGFRGGGGVTPQVERGAPSLSELNQIPLRRLCEQRQYERAHYNEAAC
jgi:hypothetical protein